MAKRERTKEQKESCSVDWESDEDDWDDDTVCIGGKAELSRQENKVHARMKKRRAKYVKSSVVNGAKMSGFFNMSEED